MRLSRTTRQDIICDTRVYWFAPVTTDRIRQSHDNLTVDQGLYKLNSLSDSVVWSDQVLRETSGVDQWNRSWGDSTGLLHWFPIATAGIRQFSQRVARDLSGTQQSWNFRPTCLLLNKEHMVSLHQTIERCKHLKYVLVLHREVGSWQPVISCLSVVCCRWPLVSRHWFVLWQSCADGFVLRSLIQSNTLKSNVLGKTFFFEVSVFWLIRRRRIGINLKKVLRLRLFFFFFKFGHLFFGNW